MKPITPIVVALALGSTAAMAAPMAHPVPFKGQELAGQAKVSLAQARVIAGKARPGAIVAQELEKEPGGSGLRYAFDVASHHRAYEVGVDARTGRVLENAPETAAQEAAEVKAEAHKPR